LSTEAGKDQNDGSGSYWALWV